jgi:hypothetical protein
VPVQGSTKKNVSVDETKDKKDRLQDRM